MLPESFSGAADYFSDHCLIPPALLLKLRHLSQPAQFLFTLPQELVYRTSFFLLMVQSVLSVESNEVFLAGSLVMI